MNSLSTNGLTMKDFPSGVYEALHTKVVSTHSQHRLYEHYAGAWNAIAYRYRAAQDHGASFVSSVNKYGSIPEPEERYLQERTLFNFYSSIFSVFESTFYGYFAIGAFISPTYFPMSTETDQFKITPRHTEKQYIAAFPGTAILAAFSSFFSDADYISLKRTRNVLLHRTAPGRIAYVNAGTGATLPPVWKHDGASLDATRIENAIRALERILSNLLTASNEFVQIRL